MSRVEDSEDYAVTVEEASTLGWAPGVWPDHFTYDGTIVYRLRTERDPRDSGIAWVDYGYDGGVLRVLND